MKAGLANHLVEAFESCGLRYLVVIPATGLEPVCQNFEARDCCIYPTREEEAIAIAAGLTLGGERAVAVMAQAGVGNALNAVFTLADAYDIYFPIVVCARGKQDPNLVQRVSAKQTHQVLEALACAEIAWHEPSATEEFCRLVAARQRWIMGPIL
jgi:sulfopyruvate decarboxylase TPP-binding subunit